MILYIQTIFLCIHFVLDAIIKLLDRSLGKKMVLGLLFVVAMLFLLNAYRKWKKGKWRYKMDTEE